MNISIIQSYYSGKKVVWILLSSLTFFFCCLSIFAETAVSVKIYPESPVIGQRASLQVQINDANQIPQGPLNLPELPE